jgi:cytochrome P450
MQPDAKVKRFYPFSEGRRDCIGQALAKTNYTAVLASLLGRFHFEMAPEVRPSCG